MSFRSGGLQARTGTVRHTRFVSTAKLTPASKRHHSAVPQAAGKRDRTLQSLEEMLESAPDQAPAPSTATRGFRRQSLSPRTGMFVGLDDRYMPNQPGALSVGEMTADDDSELALPSGTPAVAPALAAAVAAVGLWFWLDPVSLGNSPVVLPIYLGALRTPDLAATVVNSAALLLAGSQQERLLGRGRFGVYYLIAIATKLATVRVDLASPGLLTDLVAATSAATGQPEDASVGAAALLYALFNGAFFPGAAILGLSSATAGYLAANWRTLSPGQRAVTGGTAAVAAAACLAAQWGYVVQADAVVAAVGFALGYWSGPKYAVMREPIIPDMSLMVPSDDEVEYHRCVVDTRSGWRSHLPTLAVALCVAALTQAALWGQSDVVEDSRNVDKEQLLQELLVQRHPEFLQRLREEPDILEHPEDYRAFWSALVDALEYDVYGTHSL